LIDRIKNNILRIIKQSSIAIKQHNIKKLKDLSNQTIHDSTTFQDQEAIEMAVLIYSLSKIYERTKYQEYKDYDKFNNQVQFNLKQAYKNLKNNKFKNYHKNIHNIFFISQKLDSNLKKYIKEIIDKGKISKASRLYEHGLSAGTTSKLLHISQWDLQDYTGRTGISDVPLSKTKDIQKRLELTRSLFK
tara:strand:- start:891 stop:1457 length:567 start_codon:yes stop_codon:yes gene_type:complete